MKKSETNIDVGKKSTAESITASCKTSAEPIVDYASAMIRLGGDRQLFLEFIAIIQEDGPELIKKIQSAIEKADYDQLEHCGHALKGLVLNFGASECVSDALAIEKAGRAKELGEIENLFNRLLLSHQRLQDELKLFSQQAQT